MERTKKEESQMLSMNETFSEFNLQVLEERLETDPLAVSALLNMRYSEGIDLYEHCTGYSGGGITCESYDW